MTAIVAFCSEGAAWLVADRASVDERNCVMRIGPKIVVAHRLTMAVAISGWLPMDALNEISKAMDRATSVAEALSFMPAVAAALDEDSIGLSDREPLVQLTIASWCSELGAAIHVVGSRRGTLGAGYQPGTLRPIGSIVQPPVPEELHPTGVNFDPVFEVRAILEHQRHNAQPGVGYGVGGGIDQVRVSMDGVQARLLVEWSDLIGKPINPSRRARWSDGLVNRWRSARLR